MKINQEGVLFVISAAILALFAHIINTSFGLIMSALALFVAYFFRDPERVLPDVEDAVISPGDGIIVDVSQDTCAMHGDEPLMRISIFLHLWDVHVNRIPYSGKVVKKTYTKGTFAHAESERALQSNENLMLKIEGTRRSGSADAGDRVSDIKITVYVRQVSGILGRRIVCYSEVGDVVKVGERYGIIKFGSRMDLYLPLDVKILVKKGQTMIGGETIIAVLK